MTCVIQERQQRFFLTVASTWSSDINEAAEFSTVRAALRHKDEQHLSEVDVLVFRGQGVYRVEGPLLRPLVRADHAEVY